MTSMRRLTGSSKNPKGILKPSEDTSHSTWRTMGLARDTSRTVIKRYQARISEMVEQVSEMAREILACLQVKIMMRAKDKSGRVTMLVQMEKRQSTEPMFNP
jgi:hypothetical protein